MKALKKVMLAVAAMMAVSAVCAVSSLAADFEATADYANGTVSITSGLENASGQMTVLVIEEGADDDGLEDSEILYINQTAANGNNTFGTMGVIGTLDSKKNYVVKVGTDAEDGGLLSYTILGEKEVEEDVYCDINVDKSVNIKDATTLIRHIAGVEILSYASDAAQFNARADVNKDSDVNIKDATRLIRHIAGVEIIEGLNETK